MLYFFLAILYVYWAGKSRIETKLSFKRSKKIYLFTRDALRGHTVSKNGSISFFTRDALRGHTVSKNGTISFSS